MSRYLYFSALHSHHPGPLPPPVAAGAAGDHVVGLVPRANVPVVAVDNANSIKRDIEHQLQVDAAQNQDDKNNYKLDDLPIEGIGRITA